MQAQTPEQKAQVGEALEIRARLNDALKACHEGDIKALRHHAANLKNVSINDVKDQKGRSFLHHAAEAGHPRVVRYLLDSHGCDVNLQDAAGETPLSLAAGGGCLQTVNALLEADADARLCKPGGPAPIHRAAASRNPEMLGRIMSVQLAAALDVDQGSSHGPPLCWAAGHGNAAAVKLLLESGADPNGRNKSGVTALMLAVAEADAESARLLVKAGADAQATGSIGAADRITALHIAATIGNEPVALDIINLLLEAGAKPDALNGEGQAAIEVAAARGAAALVDAMRPKCPPALLARLKVAEKPPLPLPKAPAAPEDPERAAALKRSGDETFVAKRYAEAEEAYTGALAHAPSDHILYANRAAARLKLESFQGALEDARKARTLKPDYTKAWFREGAAAAALKLWEDAACAFFEGHSLEPANKEMEKAFKDAIAEGRKEHEARAKAEAGRS